MKYLKYCLVFSLLLSYEATKAQTSGSINEAFYENCALISYNKDGHDVFSSGFILLQEVTPNTQRWKGFLITTKHTLPQEGSINAIKLRFFTKDYNNTKNRMELTVELTDKKGRYLPKMRFNRKGADVVAIEITEEFVADGITSRGIPMGLLLSKADMKSKGFTVGDEIYNIGYPDGIYDEKNYSPMFRYGIIATLPYERYNFNKKLRDKLGLKSSIDGFLIDANVYPGSSGSMVIYKTLNTSLTGIASFSGPKGTPYILGIVSDSIPFEDISPNNIQRMGLGIVYSSDAIKETIEQGTRLSDE
ncbi:hypothetical protein LX99_02175 [Mucilaginibacter oryzae]|uniref:Trypsin-like peptidase n=1 Tax=Mucilaginibacter oryzae TaxID=468058 RepID=A0A316HDN8_9SPHI|nr:trypsin-like peptidase domain-containing protein [Mucilaginibacter oryzae]PWK78333.1 hypothetical protein LX99_02175 [Mucilaginibacter oryzae]